LQAVIGIFFYTFSPSKFTEERNRLLPDSTRCMGLSARIARVAQ